MSQTMSQECKSYFPSDFQIHQNAELFMDHKEEKTDEREVSVPGTGFDMLLQSQLPGYKIKDSIW